jgi:hypothetical protein
MLFVEYDLSGMKESDIVSALAADWAQLVRSNVTSHPRYGRQGGRPVVGIFGFYMDRFSAATAHVGDAFGSNLVAAIHFN